MRLQAGLTTRSTALWLFVWLNRMAYKTIQESFWTDLKVRKLSPNEKLMYLYLITNPHAHYSGLYYLPISFMSEEVGLTVKTITESIDSLAKNDMIRYDHTHSVAWIIKMCKYQMAQGGNPAVLKSGILKQMECLQSRELVEAFIVYYQFLNLTLPQRWHKVESTLPQRYDTDTVPDKGIVKGKFKKPTIDEVRLFCKERENNINADEWYDHYESNGWLIGKNKTPMKDWQAAVRTWEHNRKKGGNHGRTQGHSGEDTGEATGGGKYAGLGTTVEV